MANEQIPNQNQERIPLQDYVNKILKVYEEEFPDILPILQDNLSGDSWDDFRYLNNTFRAQVAKSEKLRSIMEEIDDWQRQSSPDDTTFN